MSVSISRQISEIADELQDNITVGAAMPVNMQRIQVSRLRTLQRLAQNLEEELVVHRLGEAERVGRPMIDQLAANQFEGLARDADDKIVRPDFGGKRT